MEWCKLYAEYPDDPAINLVGEAGEVLFLRSMAWTTGKETDGFIPDWQVPKFGLPRVQARVKALVRHGLWTPVDGGWQITNWRRRQAELYTIEKRKRADALRKKAARTGPPSVDESADSPQDTPPDDPAPTPLDTVSVSQVTTDCRDLREEIPPNPPQRRGATSPGLAEDEPPGCAAHRGQPASNCRACGTSRRAVQAAADAPPPRPTWCGSCDETTRTLTAEAESSLDDVVVRCPDCHPLSQAVPA